jgi:pSer/pThr/pTyr-binding forkhead associated (FHA) protein
MAIPVTAMLFIPPLPPVQLAADSKLVLGRSRSCDVTLRTPDASRRHAEITGVTGGYVISDLGSTNGTFVNGERIEQRQLRPGDRIQIGSEAITFCEVGGGLDGSETSSFREAQTMLMERPALGEVFQGSLAEIPPFAVLQILEMGRKTGVLQVESQGERASLWLGSGVPIHAETPRLRGFDAAVAIVNTGAGRFSFESAAELPERTIEASVTELLLEASRRLDEGS